MRTIKVGKKSAMLIAAVAGTLSLIGQDDQIVELPVTVVTGDLWASQQQEINASVSVFNELALKQAEFDHFDNASLFIPNITATGGTSRFRYFQIRGIGENSQFEGETPDSAVAYFMDDLDFTGLGSVGSLMDIRQVEVLRGPQAGAFGANAAGGLIKIVSNDPTPFWTGQVEATVGSDDLRGGMLAVGGPLVSADPEKLMLRFAIQKQQSNGFYENKFLERDDTNERDELSTRLKLRWNASEDWQWNATAFYADTDNGYDVFTMGDTPFETNSDEPGRDEQTSIGFSINGKGRMADDIQFTTITSLMSSDSLYSYDADWTEAGYQGYLATEREREVVTQELRLDGQKEGFFDRWTAGVYLQKLTENSDILYRDGDPDGPWGYGQVNVSSVYETDTLAGFGQAEFDINEKTRLILGLRYELHDVTFDSNATGQGYYTDYLPSGGSANDDAVFGGKVALEHDMSERTMVFASVAKGYKAGGANSGTFGFEGAPNSYDQETLWNFESGIRGGSDTGRLNWQLNAFYLLRQDAQLRDSIGAGGWFRYLTVNGDEATHYGVEAEAQWMISEGLSLVVSGGAMETNRETYTDPGGVVEERELANAPGYNYSLRLSYKSEFGIFGSLAYAGRGSFYESNSHRQRRDAMQICNLNIGYEINAWLFKLWVRNAFDKEYASRVFYFDNGDGLKRYEGLADPRQIGTSISYRF